MSGQEEEDYSALPLLERWKHAKWNARQDAYKEATASFSASAAPTDECFSAFMGSPDLLKSAVTDSNVIALDAGIAALSAFLQFGDANAAARLRPHVLKPMLEKGYAAAKPTVKTAATNAVLYFVEIGPDPPAIVEDLVPMLSSKLPKVVVAATAGLNEIYTQFGTKTVAAQPALKALPKLFAHTDRNVRAEAVKLSVTLNRWLGGAVMTAALSGIKPVQMKELEEQFAKASADGPPQQLRLLRSQTVALESDTGQAATGGNDDVDMGANDEIDPYDLIDPVAVLAKVPGNFETDIVSAKWKERKEVLDTLATVLNTPKIVPEDFSHLLTLLVRVIQKDANIMCATQALVCVKELAIGLRSGFTKYASIVVQPSVERYKEKKASVVEVVSEVLASILAYSSLREVLPALLGAMGHKVPSVKIESVRFLSRALQTSTEAPSVAQIKEIGTPAAKLMSDTQEPVRQEAAILLGTLMKLIGERAFAPLVAGVDDIRKAKIAAAAEKIEVVAKVKETAPKAAAPAATSAVGTGTRQVRPAGSSVVGTRQPATRPPGGVANGSANTAAARPASVPHARSSPSRPADTPVKKTGARTVAHAEFTPARLPDASRRRLVSPGRAGAPVTGGIARDTNRTIAAVGNRFGTHPQQQHSTMGHTQPAIYQEEINMLRREKVSALEMNNALQKQLEQERAHREAAEQRVRSLEFQLDTLQSEMHQMRLQLESRSLPASSAGTNSRQGHALDSISLNMNRMSIDEVANGSGRGSSASVANARRITLGAPRSPRPLHGFDGSPQREHSGSLLKDSAHNQYQRAQEMSIHLRKRVEEMKRQSAQQ